MRVQIAPPEHFSWLASRAARPGVDLPADLRAFEAVDDSGRILGMVGFDSWTADSAQMSVALDSSMAAKALLVPAFAFPFEQLGLRALTSTISSDNARSLALARRVGFREVARENGGWGGVADLVRVEMTRADCSWLEGQRRAA